MHGLSARFIVADQPIRVICLGEADHDDDDFFAYEKNGASKAEKEKLVKIMNGICELNTMVNRNLKRGREEKVEENL